MYRGFEYTIHVMEKIAEMPDPEPQNTDFLACVRNREPFALDELKGHRAHSREPRGMRPAPEPHALIQS